MPALTDIPGFTREETAGLLARAALALDSGGTNPEAKAVLPGELEIRQRLVDDFRAEFPTDDEQEFKARVLDWLDQETERLSRPRTKVQPLSGFRPMRRCRVMFTASITIKPSWRL